MDAELIIIIIPFYLISAVCWWCWVKYLYKLWILRTGKDATAVILSDCCQKLGGGVIHRSGSENWSGAWRQHVVKLHFTTEAREEITTKANFITTYLKACGEQLYTGKTVAVKYNNKHPDSVFVVLPEAINRKSPALLLPCFGILLIWFTSLLNAL